MNTGEQPRHEHEEPERREGLGGRIRHFVDSEFGHVRDKENQETDQGRTSHPVTTAPVDPGYDTHSFDTPGGFDTPGFERTTHDAPVPNARLEETAPRHVGGRSSDEVAADGSAERVGLLDDPAALRDQWQRVQGTFVDDPQRAVQEASVLVERTLHEIRENVTRSGELRDRASTEDLRVSFQRYREFFQRLLSA
ncbi:MAG: hypothetical protein ACRDR6_09490 [Pseudonocardiaceae bacterium]